MSSTIKRTPKKHNFVILDKTFLEDVSLSLKAKGLLAYMLSKPDDWQFYVSELQKHSKDGRDSTRTALKELEEAKYLIRGQARTVLGKFQGYEYLLFETPQTEDGLPEDGLPENGKTENGKAATTKDRLKLNTKSTNNNKKKSSKKNKEIEIIWPADFSPELVSSIKEFIEFRKEIKKPYKSLLSINKKIKQLADQVAEYGEEIVIQSINLSIANGWQGTFPESVLKTKKAQKNNGKSKFNNTGNQKNSNNDGGLLDGLAEVLRESRKEGFI